MPAKEMENCATHDRDEAQAVNGFEGFVDEVVDEAIGTSSKKWALVIASLAVGAALALWLSTRLRGTRAAPVLTEDEG